MAVLVDAELADSSNNFFI